MSGIAGYLVHFYQLWILTILFRHKSFDQFGNVGRHMRKKIFKLNQLILMLINYFTCFYHIPNVVTNK